MLSEVGSSRDTLSRGLKHRASLKCAVTETQHGVGGTNGVGGGQAKGHFRVQSQTQPDSNGGAGAHVVPQGWLSLFSEGPGAILAGGAAA